MIRLIALLLATASAWAGPHVLPTPQYQEALGREVKGPFKVLAEQPSARVELAAEMLRQALPQASPQGSPGAAVHLWSYGDGGEPPIALNVLDREVLTNAAHWQQSYVIVYPDDGSVWVVGASPQGVLWGAATLVQLLNAGALTAAYIRDYPDFEFRAASDWLLNIEINGWALDRGQSVDAFARTVEEKLDRAVRYKINMVMFDGFGFSLSKRPAWYPGLMERLNRYARARGIHLMFGGYGASYGMAYEPVVMYENGAGFLGTVFENRHGYPNGPKYRCMGFPKVRTGYDPATLGSCRSNEELNRLKAKELREFVEAVEPGALYIHHEDFGGFAGTQRAWLDRCDNCRRRWPNDALEARDGGAGGLANGYAALVRAVEGVRNSASGYDASRDCQIVLVSPVYVPDDATSESWAKALELWRNIGLELPHFGNVQACFREVWPLNGGGRRWTEMFAETMKSAGLALNTFLFYAGGADRFTTDYPLSGAPAMNALFRGARGIYNASGDFYQEPMELINAEYSWNARSIGSRVPQTSQEAHTLLRRYAYEKDQPPEVFGAGGLYERACRLLYGDDAAAPMMAYYRLSAELPDTPPGETTGRPMTWLPLTWDRAYAAPPHWRHLVQDSYTWPAEIRDETFAAAVGRMGIDSTTLHQRLAARWRTVAQLNREGESLVRKALAAQPREEAREDLEFLATMLSVYQPLTQALAEFHAAVAVPAPDSSALTRASELASRAHELALAKFPKPVDPIGGELGALRNFSGRLVTAIAERKAGR